MLDYKNFGQGEVRRIKLEIIWKLDNNGSLRIGILLYNEVFIF